MSLNEVALWSEILTGIATFLGLFFVALEIRKSKNTELRQTSFEMSDSWRSLSKDRNIELNMSWNDYDDFKKKYFKMDLEAGTAWRNIMSFWETVGEAAFLGLVDKEIVFTNLGFGARGYWKRNAEIILARRLDVEEPMLFSYFEWFALESNSSEGKIDSKLASRIQELHLADKNSNIN
jgi:hypothetical protein